MVDSPTKIYKDYVRANLPNGMSYDTGTNRYDINNHSFFSYNNSNWYYQYISKYGYSALSAYAANGFDPALVFDFKNAYFRKSATDSTFAASITHARASSATMMNASGTLVTVGNNVPRTGHHSYNGSAWVNEGILHESEARTNLLLSSGDVAGTGWVAQGAGATTVGSVTTGSPFGTYQSVTVNIADSINPAQRYQIFKSITSGQTYVSSALLKHSVGTFWAVVDVYDTASSNKRAWFDLQNGVVGTKDASILQSGMIDYGDGWWLCWASATVASNSGGFNVELTKGDGILGRTVGDTMLIAGPQFEQGPTPSSYIPTTSATVTRAADLLTVPAASLPYDNTNMSIQMDGKMTGDTLTPVRWLLDANNSILLETGSNNFSFTQEAVGTVDTVTGGSFTSGTNVPFNLATRNGSTFINGAISGTALTANTTPTALPNLSSTDLNLGYGFMGTIGQFRMWSEDLADVGIAEAST